MARRSAAAKQRLIDVTILTDAEIRKVARDAAEEADRIIRSLGSDSIRSAQVALAKANVEMWAGVKDAVSVGIGDAVDSASEFQALFDERLFNSVNFSHSYWRQSMLAQAREGINSFISRKEGGFTLSERVYRNGAVAKGQIDRIVNNGLLLGKSAAEIARDVRGFIDPSTPGGSSYAAMRLGRTEVNNAFHQTSIRNYQDSPWVEKVLWNLSGSHPRPDLCNEYAESVHHSGKGWEAGEYKPGDVPDKPHPNCLCYIEPVAMSLDAFAKNFKAGKYDSHIYNKMGCSRVA